MGLFKKKYPGLGFCENFLGGHMSIKRLTIYGENAMHWGITYRTRRWGYLCFRLPFRCFGCWWPLYFYVSPNATPWASTFYIGKSREQRELSKLRREAFGHNFDDDKNYEALSKINGYS